MLRYSGPSACSDGKSKGAASKLLRIGRSTERLPGGLGGRLDHQVIRAPLPKLREVFEMPMTGGAISPQGAVVGWTGQLARLP